jgi:hypothetical protein
MQLKRTLQARIVRGKFSIARQLVIRACRSFPSGAEPSARKVARFYARLDRMERLRAHYFALSS